MNVKATTLQNAIINLLGDVANEHSYMNLRWLSPEELREAITDLVQFLPIEDKVIVFEYDSILEKSIDGGLTDWKQTIKF